MKLRLARIEDHDDLVPIFDSQTEVLTKTYGEFFLADLISSQNENDKCLVADVNGRAVGLMSLTDDVDIKTLQNEFDLDSDKVICITLFCLDENYQARVSDFLPAIFAIYPDKEYCILTQPHTCPESRLLSMFTLALPRPTSEFTHVLYYVHRDSVSIPLAVRWAEEKDLSQIKKLVEHLDDSSPVLSSISDAISARTSAMAVSRVSLKSMSEQLTDQSLYVFQLRRAALVVTYESTVVGLVLAGALSEPAAEELRSHYGVEEHVSWPHLSASGPSHLQVANLELLLLDPAVAQKKPFVVREVMRLFYKSVMVHTVAADSPAQDVLNFFLPVRPRRLPPQVGSVTSSTRLAGRGAGYACFMTSRRLLTTSRTCISDRVLVVGASVCALACLESLCMRADVRMPNITLLSPQGLPVGRVDTQQQFLPWDLAFDQTSLSSLGLHAQIKVVRASLVGFDCAAHRVRCSNGATLHYDHLLLAPGLQTALPPEVPDDIAGVVRLSGQEDVPALELALQSLGADGVAVVYGSHISALTAIHGLVATGVSPQQIVWAHGSDAGDVSWCFDHAAVGARIRLALQRLGVREVPSVALAGVRATSEMQLQAVVLRTGSSDAELEEENEDDENAAHAKESDVACRVLALCGNAQLSPSVFAAATANSLVVDGRLVVDASFATADAAVLAAGTAAKFSRKFGQVQMEMYDSSEVGKHLANSLIGRIRPGSKAPTLPPRMSSVPKVYEALLPGQLHLLHSQSPRSAALHPVETSIADRITTLRFDNVNVLRALTYLGPSSVPGWSLSRLVGLPGSYLNRLQHRVATDSIRDLSAFLQAPWAAALAHEDFPTLRRQMQQSLSELKDDGLSAALVQLEQARQSQAPPDPFAIATLAHQLPPRVKERVQRALLVFLQANTNHLPGYVLPE